jgi:hypothetical protein
MTARCHPQPHNHCRKLAQAKAIPTRLDQEREMSTSRRMARASRKLLLPPQQSRLQPRRYQPRQCNCPLSPSLGRLQTTAIHQEGMVSCIKIDQSFNGLMLNLCQINSSRPPSHRPGEYQRTRAPPWSSACHGRSEGHQVQPQEQGVVYIQRVLEMFQRADRSS